MSRALELRKVRWYPQVALCRFLVAYGRWVIVSSILVMRLDKREEEEERLRYASFLSHSLLYPILLGHVPDRRICACIGPVPGQLYSVVVVVVQL